jgi:hypothetical protein
MAPLAALLVQLGGGTPARGQDVDAALAMATYRERTQAVRTCRPFAQDGSMTRSANGNASCKHSLFPAAMARSSRIAALLESKLQNAFNRH